MGPGKWGEEAAGVQSREGNQSLGRDWFFPLRPTPRLAGTGRQGRTGRAWDATRVAPNTPLSFLIPSIEPPPLSPVVLAKGLWTAGAFWCSY